MVIENINASYKQWFRSLASTIILGILISLLFTIPSFNNPPWGLSKIQTVIILLIIYLVYILIPIILNYQFIYISDDDEKFTIRYYNISFIPGKKKAIVFDLSEFDHFEVTKSVFNLRENLVIYRKMQKGIVKYPPISLMGFKPAKRKKAIQMLTSLNKK